MAMQGMNSLGSAVFYYVFVGKLGLRYYGYPYQVQARNLLSSHDPTRILVKMDGVMV